MKLFRFVLVDNGKVGSWLLFSTKRFHIPVGIIIDLYVILNAAIVVALSALSPSRAYQRWIQEVTVTQTI